MPVWVLLLSSSALVVSHSECFFGRQREPHHKRAPLLVLVVPAQDFATVRANDAITDAQSQPRALAGLFGREEGIENSIGLADAGAVVDERNLDGIVFAPCSDANSPMVTAFLNRVVRVIENVQKNLLQLLGVPKRGQKIFF